MRISKFLILILVMTSISSCAIFKKKTKKQPPVDVLESSILQKYSQKLGVKVSNEKLYKVIESWIGTPYKFGGKSKSGIDCSNFSCQILKEVFSFPSTYYFPSAKLAEQGHKIDVESAQEGDVVFFSINQNSKISHVGIYLVNNYFVHASTSKGVMISSLNEDYFKKRFSFCRRLN